MDNPKNAQEPQPKHLIATIKGWNIQRARELIHKHPGLFSLVTQPEALASKVEEIQPQYIFFPHWSWITPKRIYEAYECVVFHMTDLPFFRPRRRPLAESDQQRNPPDQDLCHPRRIEVRRTGKKLMKGGKKDA